MKKCKNCVCYKTRECPKTMWVGSILLGEEKLKNITPCEKYEYLPLLQRLKKMYNKDNGIVSSILVLVGAKWHAKRAERKFRNFQKRNTKKSLQ